MDQIVHASAQADEFSGTVLVARDGQILLDRGYGFANREWRIPNDTDTKFRLGSITKQFTAVAIMILNERGLVDLDAPVKTWVTDAPAAWDQVTVLSRAKMSFRPTDRPHPRLRSLRPM